MRFDRVLELLKKYPCCSKCKGEIEFFEVTDDKFKIRCSCGWELEAKESDI